MTVASVYRRKFLLDWWSLYKALAYYRSSSSSKSAELVSWKMVLVRWKTEEITYRVKIYQVNSQRTVTMEIGRSARCAPSSSWLAWKRRLWKRVPLLNTTNIKQMRQLLSMNLAVILFLFASLWFLPYILTPSPRLSVGVKMKHHETSTSGVSLVFLGLTFFE